MSFNRVKAIQSIENCTVNSGCGPFLDWIHDTILSHGMLGVVLRQLLALCSMLPYSARMGHGLGGEVFSTSNRFQDITIQQKSRNICTGSFQWSESITFLWSNSPASSV